MAKALVKKGNAQEDILYITCNDRARGLVKARSNGLNCKYNFHIKQIAEERSSVTRLIKEEPFSPLMWSVAYMAKVTD